MPAPIRNDYVTMEVMQAGQWTLVGSVSDVEPPASVTSDDRGGRDVYLAGWIADHDGPGVWRSVRGFDHANAAIRVVHTVGFHRIADLREGPTALDLSRPYGSVRTRFTYHHQP